MAEEGETQPEINSEPAENMETKEEYAYLDRGGFSSEKFKIELRGLPKFYGIVELKKLMNQKLGLNTSKIKRPKNGSHWLFACFQNEEERNKAIAALNGYSWKGKTLIAEAAKPAPDPLVRKRKQEEDGSVQDKKKKQEDNRSQDERLADATTPYWNIPYDEQLKMKEQEIKNLLLRYDNEVWKMAKERRSHIEGNRKIHNGLSFELKPIQRSPVTEELLKVERADEYEKDVWQLSIQERLDLIPTLREKGNKLYGEKKYKEAEDAYSQAIAMCEQLMIRERKTDDEWKNINKIKLPILLNYAQCKLLNGDYYSVIEHCNTVLEYDRDNEKALYRRAKAHVGAWNPDEAEKDFKQLKDLNPSMAATVDKELENIKLLRKKKELQDKDAMKKLFAKDKENT